MPTTFEGLEITDSGRFFPLFSVSNEKFDGIVADMAMLSADDRGRVRSAASLMRDAKISMFRGEDSAAVSAAVSAVEAMYLRPNSRGIFCAADPRIPLANGERKAESFKRIFCTDSNFTELCEQLDPYTVRSGHLHAGQVRFYLGDPGSRPEGDAIVQFVLRCQTIIVDLLGSLVIRHPQ